MRLPLFVNAETMTWHVYWDTQQGRSDISFCLDFPILMYFTTVYPVPEAKSFGIKMISLLLLFLTFTPPQSFVGSASKWIPNPILCTSSTFKILVKLPSRSIYVNIFFLIHWNIYIQEYILLWSSYLQNLHLSQSVISLKTFWDCSKRFPFWEMACRMNKKSRVFNWRGLSLRSSFIVSVALWKIT